MNLKMDSGSWSLMEIIGGGGSNGRDEKRREISHIRRATLRRSGGEEKIALLRSK